VPICFLPQVPRFRREQARVLALLEMHERLAERLERREMMKLMAARRI
jgi:hypothetical protein